MSDPKVSIIMRSMNEAWALRDTLPMVQRQDYTNWELIVIDSGSQDGSQELIRRANPQHFVQIQPHDYVPGRVLNMGLSLAASPWCVFLNSDATPANTTWLRPLLEALSKPNTAACFGRQMPRPDCQPAFAAEYDRCFGPGRKAESWPHFFSMVSSGLRREIWEKRGFREDLQMMTTRDGARRRATKSLTCPLPQSSTPTITHPNRFGNGPSKTPEP